VVGPLLAFFPPPYPLMSYSKMFECNFTLLMRCGLLGEYICDVFDAKNLEGYSYAGYNLHTVDFRSISVSHCNVTCINRL